MRRQARGVFRAGLRVERVLVAPGAPEPAALSTPVVNGAKAREAGLRFEAGLRSLVQLVAAGLRRARQMRAEHTSARRMRVVETIALGEKRFAALLQVDGAQFLVGGGAGNVSLLAMLPALASSVGEAECHAAMQQADSAPLAERGF